MTVETRQVLFLADLRTVPRVQLSGNLTVRSYRPGDQAVWRTLVSGHLGDGMKVSFDEAPRKTPAFRAYRTIFVLDGDPPVAAATATAGYDARVHLTAGELHFVGVAEHPEAEQLLRIACLSALEVMVLDGRAAAWADVIDPLIMRILKSIGFRKTQLPPSGLLEDHTDYRKRTKPLYRWHTGRIIGESTGNTGDARADESLYRPGELGRASIDLENISAGEDRPFTLTYTVGQYSLPTGASVKFWMAGQGSLGTAPQIDDPTFPGFVECQGPDGVELAVICDKVRVLSMENGENPPGGLRGGEMVVGPTTIGFTVKTGKLCEGNLVRLIVGKPSGFTWKKLADRKEFKVIIDPGNGEPRMRLPEPVKVNIRPLVADHLEVLLPATARTGDSIDAFITVRDRFDNRVDFDGAAEALIRGGEDNGARGDQSDASTGNTFRAYFSGGRGKVNVGVLGNSSLQVEARCEVVPVSHVSNPCVPSADYQLFIGDMHTHDFQSTAEGYPADCYRWGRDEKRLDFQALPIQVHRWIDNEKWTIGKHMNEYFLDEGKFVTFLSFEWQHSQYGDKVIHFLGGDMPYLPIDDPRYADPPSLYEALRGTDAFIISHHPGYEMDLHVPGTRWETVQTDIDRLAEIWSMHGSSEGFDPTDRPIVPPRRPGGVYDGLRQGAHMGIVAGSDTHTARPGGSVGEPRPYWGGLCAVWARELTRRSLFEAFKARRTYALTGSRIVLRFSVNDAFMGSDCELSDVRRLVVKTWAPARIKTIQLLRDAEMVKEFAPGTASATVEYIDRWATPSFYHCRVELQDGQKAVCSPVWIG